MSDSGDDLHFTATVTEDFRRDVVIRILRWQMTRARSTWILLAILFAVGLVVEVGYGIWYLIAVVVGLVVLLVGVSYLQVRRSIYRNVALGSELSTSWGATTLTLSDGDSTSTMPYSLVRRVVIEEPFAIVQMVRSPRNASFWPSEVFPPEAVEAHRIQFGGAGRG